MINPQVQAIIDLALAEDLGSGDLSGQSAVPADARASGSFLLKSPGVLSGFGVVDQVCRTVDSTIEFTTLVPEGVELESGVTSCNHCWPGPFSPDC